MFRRQTNEEPLLLRPMRDLRTNDEQGILQENLYNPQENQQNKPCQFEEDQHKNPQENRGQNLYNEQQQPSQADQTQGAVTDERDNQPRKPHTGYTNQQKMESQNQPEVGSFNQPQMESQNQPQTDSFNQAQIDSYNQPPMGPYYNQPPMDPHYNQSPMDSSYNQPPIKSKYPPETESYNQPVTGSYNQSPDKSKNQSPMDSYNQPQMDLFSQPHVASHNQPQRPINSHKSINYYPQGTTSKPPQVESYMPSQEDPYNQPQIGSYKNPIKNILKLSPFKKIPAKSYYEPQAETFNQTELGSFRPSSLKAEPERVVQYSHKQTKLESSQMESFKQGTTGSYNPLDIIMAENYPEEGEPPITPLVEDLYKPPSMKQPNDNSPIPQSAKPAIGKLFLSRKNPKHSTHQGQPLGQPFEEPQAPPFDLIRTHSAPQEGPRNSALEHPQDKTHTFEKMFSQLNAETEALKSPPLSKEETFDELFRDLHEGGEEPRDKKIKTRMEQPIEQEAEQ